MTRAQLQAAEDLILEAIVTPDPTPYGAKIRNKGREALKDLLAEIEEATAFSRQTEDSQSS